MIQLIQIDSIDLNIWKSQKVSESFQKLTVMHLKPFKSRFVKSWKNDKMTRKSKSKAKK